MSILSIREGTVIPDSNPFRSRGIQDISMKDVSMKDELRFWENQNKAGDHLDLRLARDLPDNVPKFILGHLEEFERLVAAFAYEGAKGLVLDAGCGNGNLLVHAQEMFPARNFRAIGIDFSRLMLKRASQRVTGEVFLQGGVHRLPFRDRVFDRVVCSGVITCLPSQKVAISVLDEFSRVLRPGGILVADFFNSASHSTLIRKHLLGEDIFPPEYMKPREFQEILRCSGFNDLNWRGFDFKPVQGYLFMSKLRCIDPFFLQERFTRLMEKRILPLMSRLSTLGYRVYVKAEKI